MIYQQHFLLDFNFSAFKFHKIAQYQPIDEYRKQPNVKKTTIDRTCKSTRDNYIPKITGSVTSFASGASKAFTNPREVYDEEGKVVLPKDTRIKLYPTYTRKLEDKYYVDVAGWMSAPGAMNRKNRVMMSVIKQLMKRDNQDVELQFHFGTAYL